MSAPCASSALRISETVAAACSFSLNLLLVVVVVRCRTNELRVYSRLILCNCAVDCVFAIASFVAEPHADIHTEIFVIFNNGMNFGIDDFSMFLFYQYSLYAAITITAVPMVYRYLNLCRDILLNGKQTLAIVSFALLMAAPVPLTVWLVCGPASKTTSTELVEDIPTLSCHGQREVLVTRDVLEVVPPCLVASFVLPMVYGTVVFCAVKVHRLIRASKLGDRKEELQKQIGYALLAQSISPVFTAFLPLGTVIVVASFGLEGLHDVLMSATSFCSYIPVLNPIMTLCFIKPYRNVVLRICGRHSTAVSSQQQLSP